MDEELKSIRRYIVYFYWLTIFYLCANNVISCQIRSDCVADGRKDYECRALSR